MKRQCLLTQICGAVLRVAVYRNTVLIIRNFSVNFQRHYWSVALYRGRTGVMSEFDRICPIYLKDRRSGLELVSESGVYK